jgi:hypothetical protein
MRKPAWWVLAFSMSRPAWILVGVIAAATVGIEIAVYLAYRNTVDGQAALPGVFTLVYAGIAVGLVRAGDGAGRRFRQRH